MCFDIFNREVHLWVWNWEVTWAVYLFGLSCQRGGTYGKHLKRVIAILFVLELYAEIGYLLITTVNKCMN